MLGYCIQCDGEGEEACRLLSEEGEVLKEGGLDELQEHLGTLLKQRYGDGNPNLPFWTMGGKQFWADQYVLGGWRIQENVFTGHHRLLTPGDVRRAWGGYEECRAVFESIRAERSISPRSSHWVVLIHGIFRSADSMEPLREELENAGYEVLSVNYPSSRGGVPEHARQLASVLNRARGDARTISFVTHSMGGIVLRKLLSLDEPWQKDLRTGRIVMLAPPSKGSNVAATLNEWYPARLIAGAGLEDLTPEEVRTLPFPDTEFGIIAGSGPGEGGWNPLLEGDDDGTLKLENVKSEQATDFMTVESQHTLLLYNNRVASAVRQFLEQGTFPEHEE